MRWPSLDPLLALLGLALLVVGLVAISSASIEYAEFNYNSPWFHTKRHLMYIAIAVTAGFVVYQVPSSIWLKTGWAWLFAALILLILVLLPGVGKDVNGSQRWLPLGPFTLQPSEFAKMAMVVYLAGYLDRQADAVRNSWQGFMLPVVVVACFALLLMVEPDFGATVIVAATAFGLMFLAGVRLMYFIVVLGLSVAGLVALIFSAPYRVQRLTAYTDPWADPFGSGFQLVQSLIAFGRGEWLGVGLGNSVQKLFYLPEAHTDFVFSIWAEETGFLGASVVILLYAALIGRILWVGRKASLASRDFSAYICYGVALVFSGQAFVNMGVSSGLLPTKGLTLPFISYGGTSLIVCCSMLAMVLRIQQELRQPQPKSARRVL
ncbi:putative lipid II flippase FtsW [Sediminihaliea albiluteola]|nr:putative lipid II flippase FtsW [Sediminihaliea albiluteola]